MNRHGTHDERGTYSGRNVRHRPINESHDLARRTLCVFGGQRLRRLEGPDRSSQSRESLEGVGETRVL